MNAVFNRERAEEDVAAPIAPKDEKLIYKLIGIDVDDVQLYQQDYQQGAEIPQGQVVERGDHLLLNGVEIFKDTKLATMREVCSFYHLRTSHGLPS